MKKIIYITMICLFLSTPALAQGKGGRGPEGMNRGGPGMGMEQRGPGGGQHRKWWQNPETVAELGLTSEQVEKINKITTTERRKSVRLRADAELLSIDLEEAMEAETIDAKKIESLIDKYTSKRGEIHKEHMLTLLKIRSVLTNDQFTKLQSKMRSHFKKGGRRERMKPGKQSSKQKK